MAGRRPAVPDGCRRRDEGASVRGDASQVEQMHARGKGGSSGTAAAYEEGREKMHEHVCGHMDARRQKERRRTKKKKKPSVRPSFRHRTQRS